MKNDPSGLNLKKKKLSLGSCLYLPKRIQGLFKDFQGGNSTFLGHFLV